MQNDDYLVKSGLSKKDSVYVPVLHGCDENAGNGVKPSGFGE